MLPLNTKNAQIKNISCATMWTMINEHQTPKLHGGQIQLPMLNINSGVNKINGNLQKYAPI